MRSILTRGEIGINDIAISPGQESKESNGYPLQQCRVLLWAGVWKVLVPGTRIQSGTLLLRVIASKGVPGTIGVARLTRQWFRVSVDWNDPWGQPGGDSGSDHGPFRDVSFVPSSDSEMVAIDVTEDLRAWTGRSQANLGWIIRGSAFIGGASSARLSDSPSIDVSYDVPSPEASSDAGISGSERG